MSGEGSGVITIKKLSESKIGWEWTRANPSRKVGEKEDGEDLPKMDVEGGRGLVDNRSGDAVLAARSILSYIYNKPCLYEEWWI
jgi:hypothetical protein